jgi:hypothetical protein
MRDIRQEGRLRAIRGLGRNHRRFQLLFGRHLVGVVLDDKRKRTFHVGNFLGFIQSDFRPKTRAIFSIQPKFFGAAAVLRRTLEKFAGIVLKRIGFRQKKLKRPADHFLF